MWFMFLFPVSWFWILELKRTKFKVIQPLNQYLSWTLIFSPLQSVTTIGPQSAADLRPAQSRTYPPASGRSHISAARGLPPDFGRSFFCEFLGELLVRKSLFVKSKIDNFLCITIDVTHVNKDHHDLDISDCRFNLELIFAVNTNFD